MKVKFLWEKSGKVTIKKKMELFDYEKIVFFFVY